MHARQQQSAAPKWPGKTNYMYPSLPPDEKHSSLAGTRMCEEQVTSGTPAMSLGTAQFISQFCKPTDKDSQQHSSAQSLGWVQLSVLYSTVTTRGVLRDQDDSERQRRGQQKLLLMVTYYVQL